MKNKLNVLSVRVLGIVAIIAVFTLSAATCIIQSGGGGKSLNSAEALKEYLDKQPANSPDKPIKIKMNANAPMLPKISEAIKSTGKYVSLNFTGNIITTIPEKAFYKCETLVNITIPNIVTNIGEKSFSGCSSITSITIPDNVTSIEGGAFSGCTGLTSITIPDNVTSIEGGAFSGCTGLTSVTIPDNVTSIEYSTFSGCTSITSITIPDSVESIGKNTFYNCTSLTSITIPDSVESIGENAFHDCTSLTSVTFQGKIYSDDFYKTRRYYENYYERYYLWISPFDGNLCDQYRTGGIGTYTTTAPVGVNSIWIKQ